MGLQQLAGRAHTSITYLHMTHGCDAGGEGALALAALEFDVDEAAAAELVAALTRMLGRAHGDLMRVRARSDALVQAARLSADAAAARLQALRELRADVQVRCLPEARDARLCRMASLIACTRSKFRSSFAICARIASSHLQQAWGRPLR